MQPKKPESRPDNIEYENDGGGTTATLVVGGLIVLMVGALVALLFLTFNG
ncbi:transmembrane domain-containing protein [Actinoplanes sp. NPDC051513]